MFTREKQCCFSLFLAMCKYMVKEKLTKNAENISLLQKHISLLQVLVLLEILCYNNTVRYSLHKLK
jgi:hypothetical protein